MMLGMTSTSVGAEVHEPPSPNPCTHAHARYAHVCKLRIYLCMAMVPN
jgi:hypothetical protein